ncbi:hypothetical protein BBK36DRAFT_1130663 [Trichoderma citrinoviride]|uniref:Transcription factor domain-containing protein n=1 Tax=Trichoderma citrinoviride TaxID=58853 RepID=A0A2T4AXR4_9HYPO|nr:hypothetical protein BBK36DRAFT_1130663 [Trichoderma citrinoviride]PTB61856.1 hypothetical protein BBK36DRAFT_1130663 [Trichoderma citrinoviride]
MTPKQQDEAADPPSDGPHLLFINTTGSARGRPRDAKTKRQIRQHVMRDIGKARRKPPRNPQVKLRPLHPLPPLTRPFWDQHPLAILEATWAMDAFAAYGLALAVSWNLSAKNSCKSHFWFPFAFKASNFCRSYLTGPEVRTAIHAQPTERNMIFALARSTENVSCIEMKLRDPDINIATADNVIRAVVGCICYNYIIGDLAQARVHLDGLKLLISMRGGIESLSDNQETILMLFWIDTISSLLFDQKPRFPMPSTLLPPITPHHHHSHEILTPLPYHLISLCPSHEAHHLGVVSALRDIGSLTEVIQSNLDAWGDDLWKEEVFLGTRLNPIAYRLLDSPPHPHADSTDLPCCFTEALRLGVLLWILGVKQKAQAFPGSPALYVNRLLHLLRSQSVKNLISTTPYFIPFQLWLLLLCATMSELASERISSLEMVANMMSEYDWAWEQVMANVKQLPWISGFEARVPSLSSEVELLRRTV